jgi:hypothetical protein
MVARRFQISTRMETPTIAPITIPETITQLGFWKIH